MPTNHARRFARHGVAPRAVATKIRALVLLLGSSVACVTARAQTPIPPVVDLTTVTARSTQSFRAILGVSESSTGQLLVNDAGRRQRWLLDATLAHATLVADSITGTSTSYGRMAVPFIRWRGDTVLVADIDAQTLLMIDATGTVRRSVALPAGGRGSIARFVRTYASVDAQGRLLYRSPPLTVVRPILNTDGSLAGGESSTTQDADSAMVLRFDLDTRRVDTIGRVQQIAGGYDVVRLPDGRLENTLTINPLRTIDDWAVLSDGTVAFVRGHDYHVDWILPDGSARSSAKLPFDWKHLTDDDKQKLIDSARTAEATRAGPSPNNTSAAMAAAVSASSGTRDGGNGREGGSGGGDGGRPQAPPPLKVSFVAPSQMADFYPPIRAGSLVPDADGNLWILPTTSAQSRAGELVYDVVNARDGLIMRVRLPAGRVVIGFGAHGVVYVTAGSIATGNTIERMQLPSK